MRQAAWAFVPTPSSATPRHDRVLTYCRQRAWVLSLPAWAFFPWHHPGHPDVRPSISLRYTLGQFFCLKAPDPDPCPCLISRVSEHNEPIPAERSRPRENQPRGRVSSVAHRGGVVCPSSWPRREHNRGANTLTKLPGSLCRQGSRIQNDKRAGACRSPINKPWVCPEREHDCGRGVDGLPPNNDRPCAVAPAWCGVY